MPWTFYSWFIFCRAVHCRVFCLGVDQHAQGL